MASATLCVDAAVAPLAARLDRMVHEFPWGEERADDNGDGGADGDGDLGAGDEDSDGDDDENGGDDGDGDSDDGDEVATAGTEQQQQQHNKQQQQRSRRRRRRREAASLPQELIAQVGEGLLLLVQRVEPFSRKVEPREVDEVRARWRRVRSGCRVRALVPAHGVRAHRPTLPAPQLASALPALAQRPWAELAATLGVPATFAAMPAVPVTGDAPPTAEADSGDEAVAARFCTLWVHATTHALSALFLLRVLRIARLSRHGVAQLVADTEYLQHVRRSLGIARDPVLADLRRALREKEARCGGGRR